MTVSILVKKLGNFNDKFHYWFIILGESDVKDTLRRLHDDFVFVPADKSANNVIVVCKNYTDERIGHQHKPISVPTPHIFHQLTHLKKF